MMAARLTKIVLVAIPALALFGGTTAHFLGEIALDRMIFVAGTVPVLGALLVTIVASLARGEIGLDLIATLAMAGSLALGEYLAGVVIALMLAGGQGLEAYAEGRVRREMSALLSRMPRFAQRVTDGEFAAVAVEELRPDDRILVRTGEVAPVDGVLDEDGAVLDESALTGESLPVACRRGASVSSGVTNAGSPFVMVASRTAAESTYAGIVRLVEAAQRSKAPMARLADRWALVFLAATAALAGAAYGITGDPLRALAVLVVATPCPLILAVPVAIVSGMSRAAKRGVLVKSARARNARPGAQAPVRQDRNADRRRRAAHVGGRRVEDRPGRVVAHRRLARPGFATRARGIRRRESPRAWACPRGGNRDPRGSRRRARRHSRRPAGRPRQPKLRHGARSDGRRDRAAGCARHAR